MTVEAERRAGDLDDRREVSGAVIITVIDMVRAQRGDAGVAQALALAGESRTFSALGDAEAWSSQAETVALFNAAALVTGDGAVGLHVGESLLFVPDATGFTDRLHALGSPEVALKHVSPLLGHFESTSEAVALEVAPDHALIRVSPTSSDPRHAHLCEMTRGLLTSLPMLFDLDRGQVTEIECSARGGRSCLYALSWDDPSSPPADRPADSTATALSAGSAWSSVRPEPTPGSVGTTDTDRPRPADPSGDAGDHGVTDRSVVELRAELNRMGVLIEGTFATALELLGDDVDSLLSQIAARADAVVTAHRYLLMVRVRPGTPIQLHHRGLEADEAQRLAAELWKEDPANHDESRVIVDIASHRRRYGRLVEFLSPGAVHPASENKVLSLYAEYAATALDIFGVLLDAKQSDATARTLLSFSEALSQVTDAGDLVQVLADTVPSVTECDQSTVYLWNGVAGQLEPRARTRGIDVGDAFTGPIAPVTQDGTATGLSVPTTPAPDTGPDRSAANGIGARTGSIAIEDLDQVFGGLPKGSTAPEAPMTVRADAPEVDRLINRREVIVLDQSTEDPWLRDVLERTGARASVMAPIAANGTFLGVVAANFGSDSSLGAIHDAALHERLIGLADQAATALQNLELLEKVSHMAWHDSLTGLPNRRLFEDRVEQELVRSRRVGEPVCMFFVDLDHFKEVNDNLGHAAGDDLILQVGQRLVDTVRRQDTVARVGGDEFAILLPGLSDQLAIDQLAQRSLEAMNAPFEVFGEEVVTSASIGIAIAPDHGDSYDELLSNADEAMYRAKGRGRNAFEMYSGSLVNTATGRTAVDEQSLYADLVKALKHGEFFVVYQPYIDLRTAQINGVEALIRWRHPTLGILEPSSFISLAERSDIIVALDTWVLEQAVRQVRTWIDRGLPPLRLSVNLASRDLSNPDLYLNIERVLAETAVDPSLLELEITERVVLEKSGSARDNIERLRRLGVRFTIDDFGTGNSSLNRIGSFPVSTLKIDQSFVQVLGPDGDNNTLVSAIISMADRLGLACVAEGVETAVQSRVLLQRGCTTAQGYFFSPPLPPEDIEEMLANISTDSVSAEGLPADDEPADDEPVDDEPVEQRPVGTVPVARVIDDPVGEWSGSAAARSDDS
jgi:diguanylate cyclase (GGDEF)-like protein